MRREGKKEFGVYTPPSGEDSIRNSNLLGFESMSKINNIQLGTRPQTRNPNERSVERSNQIGVDDRNRRNNTSRQFEENIRQGWGGNTPTPTPTQTPTPTPTPTSTPTPTPTPTTPNADATIKTWEECYPTRNGNGTLLVIELLKMVGGRTQTAQLSAGDWSWTYGFENTTTYVWTKGSRIGTETVVAKVWDSHPRAGGADVDPTPINSTIITTRSVTKVWGRHEGFAGSHTFRGQYSIPPRPTGIPPLINGFRMAGWFGQEWGIVNAPDGCPTRDPTLAPTPTPPPSPPSLIFRGTASPPPPRRKMCGCDCNTIASIIAEHMTEKQRLLDAIKEHIDSRAVEQLQHINKMLQDIDMDLDLQPVIDEIKRVEANLWNGINGG